MRANGCPQPVLARRDDRALAVSAGPVRRPGTSRTGRWPWAVAGTLAVVAILVLTAELAPAPFGGRSTSSSPSGPGISTDSYGRCNPVGSKTPSALLQPLATPGKNVARGGSLSATFEVKALNWTTADSRITVRFPSVFFDFPKATGGTEQLYLGARTISMNFSGWSSPSFGTTRTYHFPNGLAFPANSKARIDSEKIAVTATADYGRITIEVRWQWVYTPTLGTNVHGPWSTPTRMSNWPTSIPSIFWPAPYASFLGSSGKTATIGDHYAATLGGDVANRTFFLEMELPTTGKVVQDQLQTAPLGATTYTVRILMLNYNRYLAPGTYLVHIHDVCGAMLYSKSVHAVFPPTAHARFFLTPSTCATKSITFNGTKFSNGTSGVFRPSVTPYRFSIPSCPGHPFQGWMTTGALAIWNGTSMLVSNNGTFTVRYA